MAEVPWFTSPPEAKLSWPEDQEFGYLHFIDPNGEHAGIPVTRGPDGVRKTTDGSMGSPYWHIEIEGNVATVSPSIHFIDRWHSPNPVQFKLVDEITVNW